VIIFGSYRGKGEDKLLDISRSLRGWGIRAFTAKEYGEPRLAKQPSEDQDVYNTRVSFWCVENCDIAVFVFFRGITIDVTANLESLDQGPIIEFTHLCELKRNIPILLVFDSRVRMNSMSSLFRGLVKTELYDSYVPQLVVEPNSPEKIMQDIKRGIFGFCLAEYAEYAKRVIGPPLDFWKLFRLGTGEA